MARCEWHHAPCHARRHEFRGSTHGTLPVFRELQALTRVAACQRLHAPSGAGGRAEHLGGMAAGTRLGTSLRLLLPLLLLLSAAPAPTTPADPEAAHACGLCGDAGGCLSSGDTSEADSVRCSEAAADWPAATTPGFLPAMAPLGRGVDYVGGGDLPGGGKVSSTEECCAKCAAAPTCKVWVTTDKPVDFCWLKSWPGGVTTNRGAPGIPRTDLRWTGLACQCDTTCRESAASTGFSSVVLLSAALYLGGGALYKRRRGAAGWDLLLHRPQMDQLRGLVRDGIVFCRSGGTIRGQSARRGGALQAPLSSAAAAAAGVGKGDGGRQRAKSKKHRAKKEGKGAPPETAANLLAPQADLGPAAGQAADSGAGPTSTQPASTAAGSGGRWVHVT